MPIPTLIYMSTKLTKKNTLSAEGESISLYNCLRITLFSTISASERVRWADYLLRRDWPSQARDSLLNEQVSHMDSDRVICKLTMSSASWCEGMCALHYRLCEGMCARLYRLCERLKESWGWNRLRRGSFDPFPIEVTTEIVQFGEDVHCKWTALVVFYEATFELTGRQGSDFY